MARNLVSLQLSPEQLTELDTTLDTLERLRTDNPLAYRALVWLLVAVLLAIVAHAM